MIPAFQYKNAEKSRLAGKPDIGKFASQWEAAPQA